VIEKLKGGRAVVDDLGTGWEHQRAGRLSDAETCYRRFLHSHPNHAECWAALGVVAFRLKKADEAISCYHRSLELTPGLVEVLTNLGVAYAVNRDFPAAEHSLRQAIAIRPSFIEAHRNLGHALRDQGKFAEAAQVYEQSRTISPDDLDILRNLGNVLFGQDRYDDSLAAFDCALEVDPNDPAALSNRAITKLAFGHYLEGFAEFESRLNCSDFVRPDFTQPLWNGESIAGKSILLVAEQGLGDAIQFIRYAPKVKALGATVLFRCFKPLVKLFAGFPGIDVLIPDGEPLAPFDVYAPLISLAAIFRTDVNDVPGILPVPYLRAAPELVERWSNRLEPRAPGELRVGIFWQGNPKYGADRFRSAPLEAFLPLAAVPGVKLISLQKNDGTEQIARLAGRLPLIDFSEELDRENGPFQDTAALMSLLDVMVTINSAPVHLAGALGVPTWLAHSTFPDWRWIVGRDDSPWYPTLRIFRQKTLNAWDEVFQRMARALEDLAMSPRHHTTARPISVEVAPGELVDKITILEIKTERISDPAKLANVRHELRLLTAARDRALPSLSELHDLTAKLRRVNLAQWDVEDALRDCEHQGQFDADFIRLARSVYKHNDERASYKRKVNELLGSSILEEKSYSHCRP
jgi:Flp pilus assembly protein TadD